MQAARNNAFWCDAVCRAHGLPTEFRAAAWRCLRPAPPFYPNVVMLDPAARAAEQARLEALPGAWALKDSFAALELEPLGFRLLFEAHWIARTPSPGPERPDPALRWRVVEADDELARWEDAWGEGENAPRLFLPALRKEPGVHFLIGERDGQTAAGAILNQTGGVVGVSNVFAAPDEEPARCWRSLAARATEIFPGAALVGYEYGPSLAWAQAAGFAPLHPLRVWAR